MAGLGTLDPTFKALLEQNNQLMEMVRQSQGGESAKCKERNEVSHSPEEPVMLFDEAYHLEDDGHEKLDLRMRQCLRPITLTHQHTGSKGHSRLLIGLSGAVHSTLSI